MSIDTSFFDEEEDDYGDDSRTSIEIALQKAGKYECEKPRDLED